MLPSLSLFPYLYPHPHLKETMSLSISSSTNLYYLSTSKSNIVKLDIFYGLPGLKLGSSTLCEFMVVFSILSRDRKKPCLKSQTSKWYLFFVIPLLVSWDTKKMTRAGIDCWYNRTHKQLAAPFRLLGRGMQA